jgi:aminoglycoside phosphotransferase (APT) family kinase protein
MWLLGEQQRICWWGGDLASCHIEHYRSVQSGPPAVDPTEDAPQKRFCINLLMGICTVTTVDPTHDGLLNIANLEVWLGDNAPNLGSGPLEAIRLQGGISNAVFKITRGSESAVLRRPPKVPRPDSERVIHREATLLKALMGSDVPSPDIVAYCEDKDVLGEKFYVMEFIDGFLRTGTDKDPAPYNDKKSPAYFNLAYALLSGTEKLAMIDYKAVGLTDFAKPENFLQRQVDRWLGQLESYKQNDGYAGRKIEGIDYLADYLRANLPQTQHVGIIHGDYSFANSLYKFGETPRLAAMIDWELATIGDTMLDLGSVLYGFRSHKDKTPAVGFYGPDDFPFREDLAAHYAEATGRSVELIDYYVVLAIFKLAAIMEGHVARSLAGKSDPAAAQGHIAFVDRIAAKAYEIAKG